MKQRIRPFRRSALATLAAASAALTFLAAPAHAQGKADIGKLEFDDIESPDLPVNKTKDFKPKEWLEVEAGIKIPALSAEQKKSKFIDQISVKWYVAVDNPDGKGVIKLTKTINHINVPIDEEIFSSVYVSPSNLKRLTGKDRAAKSSVRAVGIEVLVDGVKVGEGAAMKEKGWWTAGSLSDQSDKFPLLSKDETPFHMLWWDRYAEIKVDR